MAAVLPLPSCTQSSLDLDDSPRTSVRSSPRTSLVESTSPSGRRPSIDSQIGSGSQSFSQFLLRRSRGSCSSAGDDEALPKMNFDTRSFVTERVDSQIHRRYDDMREIGSGGCGKVFIAKDRMFKDRIVAIKQVLKPDDPTVDVFMREVAVMKDLDHPSICRLFETYDQQRFMFFVIEYCEGGDLFDRVLEDTQIPEAHLADIIRQVAGAMKYAHSRGIAHRDLKPENICFCSKERSSVHVKVIDWGYGRYFGQGRMKSNVGTTTYSAPEVFAPRKREEGYTSTCDLWSLGVVAYVALCGKQPFWGSMKEQLRRMRHEQYPLEGPSWEGVSAEAKDFIRALLRWNPAQRLSADCVLSHPWLLAHARPRVEPDIMQEVLLNMEQFSRTPDFFSLCVASVARQVDHGSLRGIREVFCLLDSNGDGVLELEEVRAGFVETFGPDSLVVQDVSEIFSHLDLDGTGKITYTEFCAAGLGEQGYTQEHVLWAAFKTFDIRDDGRITLDEMQQVLSNTDVNQVWSEKVCQEAAREVMEEFGDRDGNINFQDWLTLMRECVSRQQPFSSRNSSGDKHASEASVEEPARIVATASPLYWSWLQTACSRNPCGGRPTSCSDAMRACDIL